MKDLNIFILGGTKDSTEIIKHLKNNYNTHILTTTTTEYGSKLAAEAGSDDTISRPLLKDEIIEVINLRAPKDEVPELLKLKHIYPAYHMNKKSWITIVLDGSCTLEEIFARIDKSYELVK